MPRLRWLIALLFVAGWLATIGSFRFYPLEYSLLTAIAFLSCVLLLGFLDGPLVPVLPIWLGLAIFSINHYLKFYLIVIDPTLLNTPPMLGLVGTVPPTEDTLFATYAAITYGFFAFCVVSALFAISIRSDRAAAAPPGLEAFTSRGFGSRVRPLAALGVSLVAAKVLMVSLFNFTRGGEHVLIAELPFHTVAIVEILVPSAIAIISLVLIDEGLRTNLRFAAVGGLAILLLDAGVDLVFMGSKSSLGRAAIMLGFFWLVTGRKVRFKHTLFFAGCGLVSAILYPFIIAFRYMRVYGVSMPVGTAMKLAATMGSDPNFHFGVVRLIFMRLTGADMVLALIDHQVERISWWTLWASGTYADHYASLEIFGAPAGVDHRPLFVVMLTPVGLFYLCAGNMGVLLGMAAFTAIVLGAWRWLGARDLAALPALCAFFMVTLFWRLMEGDLGYQALRALPLYLMAGVVVECILTSPGRMIAAAMSSKRRRPRQFASRESHFTPA
jgi:hypothetical protein